jgi:outer membrane protein assembly factor BamB
MKTRLLAAALALAGPAASRAAWPDFRGPAGDGHVPPSGGAERAGLPLRWSEQENVRWKTPIPHRGWSSPVVLDGRVWLTTATLEGNDFFAVCVDAADGGILVNRRVFHEDNPEPLGNSVNCYASPSPVIEAGRVYVHFGSYGTACLDAETGASIWERRDLPCRHFRGPGSSPILFEKLLILTMDGVDVQYVVALDKATGRTVWKTDRSAAWSDADRPGQLVDGDFRKAFSTPFVAQAGGGPRLFSTGAQAAYAYDPRTGRELWTVSHDGFSCAARPVYGKGLALLVTSMVRPELWAVRDGGEGDVTATRIAWRTDKDIGRTPSPIVDGDLFYMVSDDGVATCRETETGTPVWRERIGGNYQASPICADGRLYFFSTQGKATVLETGRSFSALATNTLDNGFMASPAVDGRALILRTKTDLYRIEAAAPPQ